MAVKSSAPSSAAQLAGVLIAASRIGQGSLSGRSMLLASPKVASKGTQTSKKKSEMQPSPQAWNGDGPVSVPRTVMPAMRLEPRHRGANHVMKRMMARYTLVEIGLVVLVGLAAKNAILIIEFAKQGEAEGKTRFEAAVSAARTRLRPILMTSFAFILGVLPLASAQGAGAEMRQSLGTAVFAGMLGVTFFGLLFTPTFYVLVRWLSSLLQRDGKVT
jgi:AcrB/AcrD/AcrF family